MTLTLVEESDREQWRDALAERLYALRLLPRGGEPGELRQRADSVARDLLPASRVLVVALDDEPVGHLWLKEDGRALDVLDLRLDVATLGSRLREAVVEVARRGGGRELLVGVAPGHADQQAFVDGGGFRLTATHLRLDLRRGVTGEDAGVRLEAMSEEELGAFLADQEESYAREREEAGESPERAAETARVQLAELVPHGMASPGQHFFVGRAGQVAVGNLWLATEPPATYVYDVQVAPEHRGQGHGRALMVAAARWARGRGSSALRLNVFGHNAVARRLYDSLGYVVLEDHFVLRLGER